jgi:uncharacterized protein (TIGR02466 family)
MILDIFKIPIYAKKLTLDCSHIEKYCLEKQSKDKGRSRSNRGGWQSKNLDNNELVDLFKEIQNNVDIFSKELLFLDSYQPQLSNKWININYANHYNLSHIHPHSIISGVFYVKGFDTSPITFHHPADQLMSYDFNNHLFKKNNEYNSEYIDLKGITGLLYLFPSWLKHGVVPHYNKDHRISISFNTQFKENAN